MAHSSIETLSRASSGDLFAKMQHALPQSNQAFQAASDRGSLLRFKGICPQGGFSIAQTHLAARPAGGASLLDHAVPAKTLAARAVRAHVKFSDTLKLHRLGELLARKARVEARYGELLGSKQGTNSRLSALREKKWDLQDRIDKMACSITESCFESDSPVSLEALFADRIPGSTTDLAIQYLKY